MKARLLGAVLAAPLLAVLVQAAPAQAATAHRVELRRTGLCLTAKNSSPGALVVAAKCGASDQEWVLSGGRMRLAGTSEYMRIGAGAVLQLGADSKDVRTCTRLGKTFPYCHVAFRYDSASRLLLAPVWGRFHGIKEGVRNTFLTPEAQSISRWTERHPAKMRPYIWRLAA